jgi:manganese transport protein
MAGQIVMEEFLHLRIRPWVRRVITRLMVMIPAVIAVAAGAQPLNLLVVSQAALSLVLPFAIFPLIDLTRRKDLMGEFANRRITTIAASVILVGIVAANALLLYQTFTGKG